MSRKLTAFQITAKRIFDGRIPYVDEADRKRSKKFAGLVLTDDFPGFVGLWVCSRESLQIDACYSAFVESIYWGSVTYDFQRNPAAHDEVVQRCASFLRRVQESVASPTPRSFALEHTVPAHVARSVLFNLSEDPAQAYAYQFDVGPEEVSPSDVH